MSIFRHSSTTETKPSVKAGRVHLGLDSHVEAGFIPRTDNEASRSSPQPERRSKPQCKDHLPSMRSHCQGDCHIPYVSAVTEPSTSRPWQKWVPSG